jgi:hypothetical protein
MSFGSNGVDRLRSLRKVPTKLRLANLCVNCQFSQFLIDFGEVTKWSETPQNMSFGSNGVDPERSLRKISTQFCLANLSVNDASLASFASTFMQ